MRYYLDCEFDGYHGPLISLALARDDGASIYLVRDFEPMDLWVRSVVRPIIFDCPEPAIVSTDAQELAGAVAAFLRGDSNPIIVADWPADIRYFCDLVEFPEGRMAPIGGLKFEMQRVDAYPTDLPGALQHNAWWDAMALRYQLSGKTNRLRRTYGDERMYTGRLWVNACSPSPAPARG